MEIDIKGVDKAALLRALHKHSCANGISALHDRGNVTEEQAREDIEAMREQRRGMRRTLYFDYYRGRVIKTDIGGDTVDPRLYDRDNGEGALARVVQQLREEG